jgi:hypothetical protein
VNDSRLAYSLLFIKKETMNGIVIFDPRQIKGDAPSGEKFLHFPLEKIARQTGGDQRMANSVALSA